KKQALILLSQLEQNLLVSPELAIVSDKSTGKNEKTPQIVDTIQRVLFKAITSERVTPVDVIIVRRAICRCLAVVFSKHRSQITNCTSTIIKNLETHTSQRTPSKFAQIVCLLYALSTLFELDGSMIPAYTALVNTFSKLWKFSSDPIRVAIVLVTTTIAKNTHRIESDWPEMFKLAQRSSSEPRTVPLRKATGNLLFAIGTKLKPNLSQNKLFDPTF
ncbi:hypothetical protein AKO1_003103, partial [Acrasis kona]